ncbi:hypothetical protein KAI37_03864 [Paenibacillus sp. S25]|uniref:Uncharacterized protein n=1 Tax=Paenibacillus peoriae TaxID=59893 RepID=A0ABU1QDF9_9BACL|nr:hypothetical protein [Paenibacillus sp. PvR133]MDR6777214.1 hypothetical protein [Paenibacillus peoriae]QYK63531.1 hypothetical protein KAI37_03864 [Paenibacillus sp. S25]
MTELYMITTDRQHDTTTYLSFRLIGPVRAT